MEFSADKQTLRYQLGARPMAVKRNVSAMSLQGMAGRMRVLAKTGKASPMTEALRFYATNHAVSLIRQKVGMDEPLTPEQLEVLHIYQETGGDVARRLLFYITTSIVREARHCHHPINWVTSTDKDYVASANFIKMCTHHHEGGAVKMVLTEPPDIRMGPFFDYMVDMFSQSFWSSAYGGPKWANVADTARQVIYGETTLEMMADTGFTLAHNGGPIFDKGTYYEPYDMTLKKILDVQNSGQIPQYVAGGGGNYEVTEMVRVMNDLMGGELVGNGVVDYDLVAAAKASTHKKSKPKKPVHKPKPVIPGYQVDANTYVQKLDRMKEAA